MLGGAWWGRNAVNLKKKKLWEIFLGGGNFWGKVKKRCGETFLGGKQNFLGGQFLEKFQQKNLRREF